MRAIYVTLVVALTLGIYGIRVFTAPDPVGGFWYMVFVGVGVAAIVAFTVAEWRQQDRERERDAALANYKGNARLAVDALDCAKRMRVREAQYVSRMTTRMEPRGRLWHTLSEAEQQQQFQRESEELIAQHNAHRLDVRNSLLGEARHLRDSMIARLSDAPPMSLHVSHVFEGSIAGAEPISQAADYLEQRARRLAP